jgi:hypothetical protein
MKKSLSLIVSLIFITTFSLGQAAWIDPNPANVNGPVKLMVDVSQPDCNCPLLLDADSLFLWTWEPTENATIPNGSWNASNPLLKMTNESGTIWSYTLVPTEFYAVDAAAVYDSQISFLVKKFDGSATPDGEPKSDDFHVIVDPPGCVNKVCSFPGIFQEDDYLTIIYDNLLESNPGLQDIPPDDCYFLPVAVAGGQEYKYINNEFSQDIATEHPELNMLFEGSGKFASTILSSEFFREMSENPVPDGVPIEMIKVRFRETSFTGNVSAYSELEFQCGD